METASNITDQLNLCLNERKRAAEELQNEVNQILASALLWIRIAKMENQLTSAQSLNNAEINLQQAIERVRALHYSLVQEELS